LKTLAIWAQVVVLAMIAMGLFRLGNLLEFAMRHEGVIR
jgi:hypothetical protein